MSRGKLFGNAHHRRRPPDWLKGLKGSANTASSGSRQLLFGQHFNRAPSFTFISWIPCFVQFPDARYWEGAVHRMRGGVSLAERDARRERRGDAGGISCSSYLL
eukprot:6493327-Pyramimonas_sp.AAC.2